MLQVSFSMSDVFLYLPVDPLLYQDHKSFWSCPFNFTNSNDLQEVELWWDWESSPTSYGIYCTYTTYLTIYIPTLRNTNATLVVLVMASSITPTRPIPAES